MFFDKYKQLCESVGKSLSAVAIENGLSKTAVTHWKQGFTPNQNTLLKIAEYFDVTTDYLLGNTDVKKPATSEELDEVNEYLEMLRTRPEMKMLFSVSKKATKEDIEQAVKIIEALRK